MIASGTNGTCTWSIDDNGELYIRPTNNNSGYIFLTALTDDYPWTEYIEQITSIILTGSIYSYKSSWSGPDEETGDFSQLFTKAWGTGQAGGKTAVNVVTIDGIESLKRPKRLDFLLQGMKKLTSIDFSDLDTTLVESFNGMFSGCDLLSQVTFGNNFDMSTAIDKAKNDPNGYRYYYYTDFEKGTNQTNGIVVQNNNEFAFLTKAERAGTWSRGVAQSFSSVAQRSTGGTPDEDGDDVIITTTWSTDSEQSNRELKIYQKLASISSYPSTPTVSQNLTGDSGITPITISNIGDDAYDFKVVFYDGVNTFIAFPAVQSNVRLITIDEKGRIECGDYNGILKPIFDIFYPVGSYYETSDSTFDPNVVWGGTWALEESGRVHVSAGTGYSIGSKGGNKDSIVPYHNHGFTMPTMASSGSGTSGDGGSHSGTLDLRFWGTGHAFTGAGGVFALSDVSSSANALGTASNNPKKIQRATLSVGNHHHSTPNHTHTWSKNGSVNYTGTSGNTTDANMQPYIVVNRWHRTA